MIKIENVSKCYEGKTAIEDISFTIVPGEIHGLIGENGVGKTTLIKCMAGIYKQDSGQITYDEEEIYDNPPVKERVGYVSDANEYIGRYTIKKLIKMYEVYFPKFSQEKFDTLNNKFKLDKKMRVDSLSKGQKMRLGFMLEVSKNPDYLLLDEPTSGLDPVAKKDFLELLVEEVDAGNIGVLISSHNLNDLEKLCDSVTILEGGRIYNDAKLDEIKQSLTKVQVVFENGVDEKLLSRDTILKCTNVGNIYTLVVRNYDAAKEKWLKDLGAGYIEELDMSLEELYVSLEERKEQ